MHYTVVETRKVEVIAETPADAVALAAAAFADTKEDIPLGVTGRSGRVRAIDIFASEDPGS